MEETVNQEVKEVNEAPKEKLFTQDEVNKFFDKRYSTMMSELDEYKKKAEKYDEIQEANKSELEKATEKAKSLEAELAGYKKSEKLRKLRAEIAEETGAPIGILSGEDEETCRKQAEVFLSEIEKRTQTNYPKVRDGGEILNPVKGSNRQQFAEFFANVNMH